MTFHGTLWTPSTFERDGWHPVMHVTCTAIDDLSPDVLAKADNPNERWITMHPHGDKDAKGVPVKIKVNPDGTAHVLSGPGELRGLRLTRLASPEELSRRKAERAEKKEAQRRDQAEAAKVKAQSDLEESAKNPEYAQQLARQQLDEQRQSQERTERLQGLSAQMQGLHRQLLEQAADLTGDSSYVSERAAAALSPDDYRDYKKKLKGEAASAYLEGREGDDLTDEEKADFQAAKGAGAVIASRNVRQISAGLKALRRDIIGKLVKDSELREAVLADGDEVDMPEERPAGGPGYTRNIKQKAAEHGYDEASAKDDADQVFSERMHALDNLGESERANAITAMREGTIRRAKMERELKSDDPADDGSSLNTPAPVRELSTKTVSEHAEKVRGFLKLHGELQALEKQHRAVLMGRDPDATPGEKAALDLADLTPVNGAEVDSDVELVDEDFARQLDAEIKDAAKADITRAFLDAAFEDEPEHEGQADSIIRKQMQAHIGAGAHAHLSNAALAALGHEGIDRTVVDALGVDAAAQLVAYAIHRDAGDVDSIRAGLAQHHDESSVPRMQDAMQFAQAARADAAEIELPAITSATDSALLRDLQKQRKEAIASAHETLGSALGAVEAGAALNLALKGQGKDKLTVRFGADSTRAALTQLHALGLKDEHLEVSRSPLNNQLTVEVNREGMDALTNSRAPEQASLDAKLRAIKRGDHDEPDYLPAGFMARNPSDLTDDPALPTPYRTEANWQAGPQQAAADVAASMSADGYKPSEIMRHLLDTVSQDCPPEHVADFSKAVHDLIPFYKTEQRTAQDGTPYTAFVATDVDSDPDTRQKLQGLSEAWMQKHHPGEADFHSQEIQADSHTREALFRAVAERPALQAAFTPPGDLGGSREGREKAKAVKDYFFTQVVKDRLGGKKPRDFDQQARAAQQAALDKLGPEPEKWGGDSGGGMFDMFGGHDRLDTALTLTFSPHATPEQQVQALNAYGLTPEHYDLKDGRATVTEAGKARLSVPAAPLTVDGTEHSPEIISGGLDGLNPQWVKYQRDAGRAVRQHPTLSDIWGDFTQTMRGTHNAYAAVQEVMQGDLLTRFTHHHAALGAQQLRVSKQTTKHWERRLAATDPDEAQRIRMRDRSVMDAVRQRGQDGKYLNMGEGGVLSAVQEHIEKQARQANMMGSLFGLDGGKAGGEVTGKTPADLEVGAHERLSLGRSAEGTLTHLLNGSRWGIKPGDAPNFLIPGLNWGKGTKHVTKQRLIKMLLESGRAIGWLGAGCVHGDTELTDAETGETRTFHKWMVAGIAPKVFALTPEREVVIAQATVPFIKDFAQMFRVTTASGKVVTVSAGHQFLSANGWARLDTLKVGQRIAAPASSPLPVSVQVLPVSTQEPDLSAFPQDVQHLSRTLQGCQGDYSSCHYPCDEQPHSVADSDQVLVPLLTGVPEHNQQRSHEGAPLPESEHSHTCQYASHHATQDCPHPVARPEDGAAAPVSLTPCESSLAKCLVPEQCGDMTNQEHEAPVVAALYPPTRSDGYVNNQILGQPSEPPVTPNSRLRQVSERQPNTVHESEIIQSHAEPSHPNTPQTYQEDNLAWDVIATIEPLDADFVYDITVPGPATYYAHGLWHHNSGKTGTMLGAFTQAHAEGRARKALYVVPSIVRNQFGEEAAKFTEPGRYTWHAEDASFEERKKHYQGDTHMLVTTHQTFRDDMLKLMADHHGVPHAQVTDWFTAQSRPERARMYAEAMHGHGIPMDMIAVDEAHDFLNRAGKQDSTMSKVLEAALDNHKFKSLWTGSPVKNDPSEIHDWLSKVDPARFGDRDEFLRRYGVNTRASAEALQRLVDSYSVIDSVRPDIDRKVVWGHEQGGQQAPLPLTPEQQQALKDVNAAFERASSAQRRGDVDVDAARTLSPRSFHGQPASEHRAIAARLQSALGTLKHSAVGRVVNEFDPQHNAKVQHVLKLAGERRGKGGVIFARNRRSIELLKSQLEAQGHKVGVINGASSTDEKGRVRNNFDSGAVDIVLCSDAGATGANLQGRGRYLVNYDLPLTMKTLEQRNARIDRLGQKEQIELHHLLTDTAYDRDNRRRLERKGDLGGILQGEYRDMDDTGLAAHIRRAQAERSGTLTPGWEEPLSPSTPAIHENARPAPRLWEPETGDTPGTEPQAHQGPSLFA